MHLTLRKWYFLLEIMLFIRNITMFHKKYLTVFFPCVFYFFSAYYKETLLNDIRKAREKYQGDELAKELARIKLRMDNTEVLTSDIVINLLLSYRDIQVCSQRLRKIILLWDFGFCLFFYTSLFVKQ